MDKSKDLWKALKLLGQCNKSVKCKVGSLAENQIVKPPNKLVLKTFEIFYSIMAGNLLKKHPKPARRYTIIFFYDYYRKLAISENFKLILAV